jgi:hypothetical protein
VAFLTSIRTNIPDSGARETAAEHGLSGIPQPQQRCAVPARGGDSDETARGNRRFQLLWLRSVVVLFRVVTDRPPLLSAFCRDGMSDPLTTELKLEWAERQIEERDILIRSLRANVDGLLDRLGDAAARIDTLKKVQDALTREKIGAERLVEQLMQEKAELASENAKLHIFAKESATKAERANRSVQKQQEVTDARAHADELLLAAATHTGSASTASDDALQSQLHALKLVLSRVLHGIQESGLKLDTAALLAPPGPFAPHGTLEQALRLALLPSTADGGAGGSAAHPTHETEQVTGEGGRRASAAAPPSSGTSSADAHRDAPIVAVLGRDDDGNATNHAPVSGQLTAVALDVPSPPAPSQGGVLGALSSLTWGFWSVLIGDDVHNSGPTWREGADAGRDGMQPPVSPATLPPDAAALQHTSRRGPSEATPTL